MFVYIPPPAKPQAPLPIPTGNATPLDVRAGKSFSSEEGTEVFGTLPERSTGPLTLVPDRTTQVKTSGIYNGDITVQPIPVQTVDTSTATVTAERMLKGETAYVKGNKITGTMPFRSTENQHMPGLEHTVWAGDRVFIRPPYGYYSGATWVTAPAPALKPDNIKSGVNILGMVGTLSPAAPQSQEISKYEIVDTTSSSGAKYSTIFTIPNEANLAVFTSTSSSLSGLQVNIRTGSYPSYMLTLSDGVKTLGIANNNRYWLINTIIIDKKSGKILYKYLSSSGSTIEDSIVDISTLDKTKPYTLSWMQYVDGGGSTWSIRYNSYGTLFIS